MSSPMNSTNGSTTNVTTQSGVSAGHEGASGEAIRGQPQSSSSVNQDVQQSPTDNSPDGGMRNLVQRLNSLKVAVDEIALLAQDTLRNPTLPYRTVLPLRSSAEYDSLINKFSGRPFKSDIIEQLRLVKDENMERSVLNMIGALLSQNMQLNFNPVSASGLRYSFRKHLEPLLIEAIKSDIETTDEAIRNEVERHLNTLKQANPNAPRQ